MQKILCQARIAALEGVVEERLFGRRRIDRGTYVGAIKLRCNVARICFGETS
jgi:hypothetical protein